MKKRDDLVYLSCSGSLVICSFFFWPSHVPTTYKVGFFTPSQLSLVDVSRATLALLVSPSLHLPRSRSQYKLLQIAMKATGANTVRIAEPRIRLLPDIFRDEQDVPLHAQGYIRQEYLIDGFAEGEIYCTRLVLHSPEDPT